VVANVKTAQVRQLRPAADAAGLRFARDEDHARLMPLLRQAGLPE